MSMVHDKLSHVHAWPLHADLHDRAPCGVALQAALDQAHEHEKAVKALSWELDQMRRLKDEQVAELTAQIDNLQRISKARGMSS